MSSYYRRMLGGCEGILVRAGYLAPGEVDARLEGRRVEPHSERWLKTSNSSHSSTETGIVMSNK